jgi:hypothetical protein
MLAMPKAKPRLILQHLAKSFNLRRAFISTFSMFSASGMITLRHALRGEVALLRRISPRYTTISAACGLRYKP